MDKHIQQLSDNLPLAPQTATLSWLLQEAKTNPSIANMLHTILQYHKEHWLGPTQIITYAQGNNSISYLPPRGGLITSLVLNGKEIFYNDPEIAADITTGQRGGYGMIPHAGPHAKTELLPYGLQNGYGRYIEWKLSHIPGMLRLDTHELAEQNIRPDAILPDLQATQGCVFSPDTGIHKAYITLTATNTGNRTLPYAPGHHTYYSLPLADQSTFTMEGVPYSNDELHSFIATGTGPQGQNPLKMKNSGKPIILHIPSVGTLRLRFHKPFTDIWIWCEPGKPFICIEPTMREGSKQAVGEILPGETETCSFSIELMD